MKIKEENNILSIESDRLELIALNSELLNLWINDIKALEEKLNVKYDAEPIVEGGFFKEILKSQLDITLNSPKEDYYWHSFWLIKRISDNVIVGSIDFKDIPDKKKMVEIGYG